MPRSRSSGSFSTSISSSIKLLKKCELFRQHNQNPKIIPNIASRCRNLSYELIWRLFVREEKSYNILLDDYSFLLFSEEKDNELSMSYYGFPYEYITIEDYIAEQLGEEYVSDLKNDPETQEEYEHALENLKSIESPVTFRYDYTPKQYDSGRHPASHIHIGSNNQIRLGCKRILNPLSFTCFVIRQQYPEKWKRYAITNKALFEGSITKLKAVDTSYFRDDDKLEMYLE